MAEPAARLLLNRASRPTRLWVALSEGTRIVDYIPTLTHASEREARLAVIWIEHIAHALKAVADRAMVLHFGRKLLEDRPQAVLESAVVREIYMGMPTDADAAAA